MSSINSISPAYNHYDYTSSPTAATRSTAQPGTDNTAREQELSRKIDSQLTEQLSRIRTQISPGSSSDSTPRRLDILA